ncbi:MAG: Ldh family oxidoreductase [Chloroflexota bacterium]|nr:Ldh family oxidoreductase [Chloroflexota bacterium]
MPVDRARALCLAVFERLGFDEAAARDCSNAILFASQRGLDSHGIATILPGVANSVARRQADPKAKPIVVRETPVTVVFKGNRAPGPVTAARAMRAAIERAREHGIGAAVAVHAAHFGAASAYAMMAADEGLFGLVMCNAHPVVAPFGGAGPLHGTNPLAYAAPAASEPPIVLDIATSAAAHGQIAKALRRGQPIPAGWALDKDGNPTTDSAAAMQGILLPFGGHKGYGIGILVDLLTGALSGTTVGKRVEQNNPDPDVGGQAFFLLAIDPSFFTERETFLARVDQLVRDAKSVPPAEGFSEVLLPGELEWREERRRSKAGIPLEEADWAALVENLGKAGLSAELVERYAPDRA